MRRRGGWRFRFLRWRRWRPDREHVEKLMPAKVALRRSRQLLDADAEEARRTWARPACGRSTRAMVPIFSSVALGWQGRLCLLAQSRQGQSLLVALQSALEDTIANLPIPKGMSYQRPDGTTSRVRPPGAPAAGASWQGSRQCLRAGPRCRPRHRGHRFLGAQRHHRGNRPGVEASARSRREGDRQLRRAARENRRRTENGRGWRNGDHA